MMTCVINGSDVCMLLKIVWNFGMKNVRSSVRMASASTSKMHGYNIAVSTFDFSSFSRD